MSNSGEDFTNAAAVLCRGDVDDYAGDNKRESEYSMMIVTALMTGFTLAQRRSVEGKGKVDCNSQARCCTIGQTVWDSSRHQRHTECKMEVYRKPLIHARLTRTGRAGDDCYGRTIPL